MCKMLKYRILLLYCILATNVCYAQSHCSDIGDTPNAIVEQYIDSDGDKVIKYGTADQLDSIMIFNSAGQLRTIQYGFGNDIPANFVLDKRYWENGNLRLIRITKDTLIVIDGHNIRAHLLEAYYHSNGVLREKGYYHSGLGFMVGQWLVYDSTGYLIEERIYVPVCCDDDGGYDIGKSYISVRTFNANGILREEKNFSYFTDYDFPIGIWRYYNEKGILYKTEEYEKGNLIRTIIK